MVEINYPKKSVKSRFIWKSRFFCSWRKILNGGGMLGKRMEAETGEAMAQELSLRDGKLTFAQADHQAMGAAQLQDVSEMLNMRS